MSTHSILDNYLRSNASHFFDSTVPWAENIDRSLGVGQHGADLCSRIAALRGNIDVSDKCAHISDAFGSADATLGSIRVVSSLERLLAGKMFCTRLEDGSWKRKSMVEIAEEILGLTARILTPIIWLHGQKAYSLGKHAPRINNTIMGIWGSVTVLDIIRLTKEMRAPDCSSRKMRQHIVDITCNVLDLAALPFDFGYGMQGAPGLAIAGNVINCISKGGYLIKEACYYSR